MKAIIPVAGKGTRLRPHTHTVPKALVYVGGKPILGHIIDEVAKLGVTEIVLIIGYMSHKVKKYVEEEYPDLNFVFAHQEKTLGLGHAIMQAEPFFEKGEPALIIYGDTIFVGDLSGGKDVKGDACIGVKMVDDPRRFGIVEKDGEMITKLVEKPDYVKTMPAIVGVNFINNTKLMFKCLNDLVEKDIKTKDEYQLTDAFQLMVKAGAKMTTFKLEGWYDCGNPKTLLDTNKYLLNKKSRIVKTENCVILPPVYLEDGCKIKDSIIGPYVTIGKNSVIKSSIIKNSIINEGAKVINGRLEESLIGMNATVENTLEKLNVGDNSDVSFLH